MASDGDGGVIEAVRPAPGAVAAGAGRGVPGWWSVLSPAWRHTLLAYALTQPFAALGYLVYAATHPALSLSGLVTRWDGWWYVHLAEDGYSQSLRPQLTPATNLHHYFSDWAFFPAYPLAIRAVHAVAGIPYLAAAVVLSSLFGLLAVRAMYALGEAHAGAPAARATASLVAAWPGAAIFLQAYSEGLFLAAAAGALLMLHRRRWVLAGLLGAVASATRPTGLAVVAAAAAVAAVRLVRARELRPLLAPALAAGGIGAFLGYGWLRTGDPLVWRHAENLWRQHLDLSRGLLRSWFHVLGHLGSELGSVHGRALVATTALEMACALILPLFLAAAWSRRRQLSLPLVVYTAVALPMIVGYSDVATRPRMLLAVLPGFVWLAAWWPRRLTVAVAVCLTPLLGVVSYLWLWKVVP